MGYNKSIKGKPMSQIINLSDYALRNAFLRGETNASEAEMFEVITILMSSSSRVRTTYYQMSLLCGAMLQADPGEGNGFLHQMTRSVIWEKQLLYQILSSIPHSDEHDLF
jgi:hypothetical protein